MAFAALVRTAGALIAVRFAMGAFAALIYPTTLSVMINTVVTDGGDWCACSTDPARDGTGTGTGRELRNSSQNIVSATHSN